MRIVFHTPNDPAALTSQRVVRFGIHWSLDWWRVGFGVWTHIQSTHSSPYAHGHVELHRLHFRKPIITGLLASVSRFRLHGQDVTTGESAECSIRDCQPLALPLVRSATPGRHPQSGRSISLSAATTSQADGRQHRPHICQCPFNLQLPQTDFSEYKADWWHKYGFQHLSTTAGKHSYVFTCYGVKPTKWFCYLVK